ncbi:MAG: hypothetical protein AAF141_02840 [Pseudomonadota bacterium]
MSAVLALKHIDADPILRGNDHFWSIIRQLTEDDREATFTVKDIVHRSERSITRQTVRAYVNKLVADGIAAKIGELEGHGFAAGVFQLVRRPIEPPRFGKYGMVRQQMWQTITYQLKAGFTLSELATYASTQEVMVSKASATVYVRALTQAGILQVIKEARPHHEGEFRLRPGAEAGPKAPIIFGAEMVFDPNTQQILGEPEATEIGGAA